MLVLFLGWLLIASVAAVTHPGQLPSVETLLWVTALWLLSQFLLFSLQEACFRGQTYGKRFMGIEVVDTRGRPPGFRAVLLRNLMRPVDNLPFGFALGTLLVGLGPTGRRLGDRVAGTCVVHATPPSPARAPLSIPEDATPAEIALLETWAHRVHTLDTAPRDALAQRLTAWADTRWPELLPAGDDPVQRLRAGLGTS